MSAEVLYSIKHLCFIFQNTPVDEVDDQTEETSNTARLLVLETLNESVSDIKDLFYFIGMWEADSDRKERVEWYVHHFFELRQIFAERKTQAQDTQEDKEDEVEEKEKAEKQELEDRAEQIVQAEKQDIKTVEAAGPSGHPGPSQVQKDSDLSANSVHTLVSEILDQGCANISKVLQMTSIKKRKEKEGVQWNNFLKIHPVFAEEAEAQTKDQAEKQTEEEEEENKRAQAEHLDLSQELQGAEEKSTKSASNGLKSWWGWLKRTFTTRSREAITVPHEDRVSNVPLEHHIMPEASVELNETKNKEDTAKWAIKVPKREGGHGPFRLQNKQPNSNCLGSIVKSKNSSIPPYCLLW